MAEKTYPDGSRCNKWRSSPSISIDDFDRELGGTCGPELIHDTLGVTVREAEALLPLFDILYRRVGIGFANTVRVVAEALKLGKTEQEVSILGVDTRLVKKPPIERSRLPECSQCNKRATE